MVMQRRCNCDATAMQLRCNGDAIAILRQVWRGLQGFLGLPEVALPDIDRLEARSTEKARFLILKLILILISISNHRYIVLNYY